MPTAGDFEDAADRLRNVSEALDTFVHPLENRMGAHVLEGGDLTDSVYESLKATRVETLSLSAIVEEYRAECVRRLEEARAASEAVEQYKDDVDDYQRAKAEWDEGDQDGEEPTPPTPPPDPPDYIDL